MRRFVSYSKGDFFFLFFLLSKCILFKGTNSICSASHDAKKAYKSNVFPPASPRHGTNKPPPIQPVAGRSVYKGKTSTGRKKPFSRPPGNTKKRSKETPRYNYYCQNALETRTVESRSGQAVHRSGSDRNVATRRRLGKTKEAVQYHDRP